MGSVSAIERGTSAMKNRAKRLCAALTLCLLRPAIGFGQAPRPQLPTQKGPFPFPPGVKMPVSLPCFLWRGLPMVTGIINGKPQKFVLDTGLNAVTISPKAQVALALPLTKSRYRVTALDTSSDVSAVAVKQLALGGVLFSDTEAAILNLVTLFSPLSPPDAPQCWVGTPLLSTFQVTFDWRNNTLSLDSPKADAPSSDDAITLPLTIRKGQIFTRLTLPGGKSFLMLIDTGAPATILPLTTFDKLHIKPFRTQPIRLANGRKAKAAQLILPALPIGSATLKNFPVVSVASDDPKDFDPDFGLIGMDALARYRVTINYARAKMTLIPY